MRDKRYRKVWILHHSSRYLVAAWLAGIPRRAGSALGWQRMLLTDISAVPVPSSLHPLERADCLLRGFGLEPDRRIPLIAPQASARAAILFRFSAFKRPWFVLGIGCSEASRQWGASNFAALANSLLQRYGGSCFLLGGNPEQVMADGISQELGNPGNLVSLIQMPLQDAIALLAETQLFLGNDTGMLNLSAACGTHSIGIFGHPLSAWVANSSPRIHPTYPEAGLSSNGVSQIRPSEVLQVVNHLELFHESEIGS